MIIDRAWSMPNKRTFQIGPIAGLIMSELTGGLWIDPFAGEAKMATITNDLNPVFRTDYNLESLDFLCIFGDGTVDGVLFDPPYSVRQIKECYESVGLEVSSADTRASWWTKRKREIARVTIPGGKVISFGWNSNGIGESLGFAKIRIMLVAHGGIHNDTICVVEVKTDAKK